MPKFRLTSRAGHAAWNAESLNAWIETLTGESVEIVETTRKTWWGSRRIQVFEVSLDATPQAAEHFLQQVKGHLKLLPL